jgi:uncharacterized small protein (DUF1192 family)
MNEAQKELLLSAISGTRTKVSDLKRKRADERAKLQKVNDVRAQIHILKQPANLNERQAEVVERMIHGLEWENNLHDLTETQIEERIALLDEDIAKAEAELAELKEGLPTRNIFETSTGAVFNDGLFTSILRMTEKPGTDGDKS